VFYFYIRVLLQDTENTIRILQMPHYGPPSHDKVDWPGGQDGAIAPIVADTQAGPSTLRSGVATAGAAKGGASRQGMGAGSGAGQGKRRGRGTGLPTTGLPTTQLQQDQVAVDGEVQDKEGPEWLAGWKGSCGDVVKGSNGHSVWVAGGLCRLSANYVTPPHLLRSMLPYTQALRRDLVAVRSMQLCSLVMHLCSLVS
jgi:hypothetical protein